MNNLFPLSLSFLFFMNIAFSLPRFAVQNGSSCIACHVNPTGSGLRNDYGTNVVALEELPLERWLDDWDGCVSEHLQVGGDFRLQGIQYNDLENNKRETAFFPMQADIYAYLKLNQYAGIPIIDIIDFNYPNSFTNYWHTMNDIPENCSGQSLEQVGKLMVDYIYNRKFYNP